MKPSSTIVVTGGAGFIGSALVRCLVNSTDHQVINVDKITYAGNLKTVEPISSNPRYCFEKVDICDSTKIQRLFDQYRPDAIIHLAAETHVDRSIEGPSSFVQSNIIGTYTLLETALKYWQKNKNRDFRFLHVSTDEVYGSLGPTGFFTEQSPYQPRSPYSASKASSDHLARAWHHTYGLPVIVTNCTNNYGPYQFPEKLIPLIIFKALHGERLPVYGRGDQVRDWLYVDDHVEALYQVLYKGKAGETYNIGGQSEKKNLEIVQVICTLLDELTSSSHAPHSSLITFVEDRPGHDRRYAMDISKIKKELGWTPKESFNSGLRKTVQWYLDHPEWFNISMGNHYNGQRLGLISSDVK